MSVTTLAKMLALQEMQLLSVANYCLHLLSDCMTGEHYCSDSAPLQWLPDTFSMSQSPHAFACMQLYRVNVLLQSPEAPDLSMSRPPFFVLRRYSQFRQLYNEVRIAKK